MDINKALRELNACRDALQECKNVNVPGSITDGVDCVDLARKLSAQREARGVLEARLKELEDESKKLNYEMYEKESERLTALITKTKIELRRILARKEEEIRKEKRIRDSIILAKENIGILKQKNKVLQALWEKECEKPVKPKTKKPIAKHEIPKKNRKQPPFLPRAHTEQRVVDSAENCESLKLQFPQLYREPSPESVFFSIAKEYKKYVGEAIPPNGDRLVDMEVFFSPGRAVGIYNKEEDALRFKTFLEENTDIHTRIWRKNENGKFFLLVDHPPLRFLVGRAELPNDRKKFFSSGNVIGIYDNREDAQLLRNILRRHPEQFESTIYTTGSEYRLIMN